MELYTISFSELTGNQGGLESGSLASSAPTYDDMDAHKSPTVQSEGREKLWNAQRSLHLLLKPELSNLCGILRLPVWKSFLFASLSYMF